jgi:hypothetical protein
MRHILYVKTCQNVKLPNVFLLLFFGGRETGGTRTLEREAKPTFMILVSAFTIIELETTGRYILIVHLECC